MILAKKFKSQQAAIDVMIQDPSVLWEGERLEAKSAEQIRAKAFARQIAPLLIFAALAAVVAYQTSDVELPANLFPRALPF